MRVLLLLIVLTSIVACSPKVRTKTVENHQPLEFDAPVLLLYASDSVPESATYIGDVKVTDSGFSSDCGLEVVLNYAKYETRMAGGNVLKLYEHQPPDAKSTCHRIKGLMFKMDDQEAFKAIENASSYTEIPPDSSYALFYVYRASGKGDLISYDVHLGDSAIYRATANSKEVLKIRKDGLNRLWAKTEVIEEIPIDVEFGRSYFLQCGMKTGWLMGRPELELVDEKTGMLIYDLIHAK